MRREIKISRANRDYWQAQLDRQPKRTRLRLHDALTIVEGQVGIVTRNFMRDYKWSKGPGTGYYIQG